MARITYIEANGTVHVTDVDPGLSVMDGAIQNDIPGILAECGGACACGTCRVVIEDPWRKPTGEASESEEAMLELHPIAIPGQRLSCQLVVKEEWDGMTVHIPEN